MKFFDHIKKAILYICLILLAITCLVPFYLMVINATRDSFEIVRGFSPWPGTSFWDNWDKVFEYFNLFRGFGNSLLVAIPATLLSAYFSALTAFALAVYKFKGDKVIFYAIVIFMMIPGQLGLIGFYDLVSALGMTNSYAPLIIPAIASPGTVFFLRQYILSVLPMSLLEAGRIDGGKEINMFHSIVLPIMAPGIATMSIGAFIGNWNSYLVPMLLLNDKDKHTLPVMMSTMSASNDITANQGATYLAIAVSVIPICIVFCFCSKYIISSISAGSVKE